LVHGAAEEGRVWRPQIAGLSDEFTLVAWDEPGAGRSSDVPVGFDLPINPPYSTEATPTIPRLEHSCDLDEAVERWKRGAA
jgi:pimeloyl-ACP methyl ester carboxylesterase